MEGRVGYKEDFRFGDLVSCQPLLFPVDFSQQNRGEHVTHKKRI